MYFLCWSCKRQNGSVLDMQFYLNVLEISDRYNFIMFTDLLFMSLLPRLCLFGTSYCCRSMEYILEQNIPIYVLHFAFLFPIHGNKSKSIIMVDTSIVCSFYFGLFDCFSICIVAHFGTVHVCICKLVNVATHGERKRKMWIVDAIVQLCIVIELFLLLLQMQISTSDISIVYPIWMYKSSFYKGCSVKMLPMYDVFLVALYHLYCYATWTNFISVDFAVCSKVRSESVNKLSYIAVHCIVCVSSW